MYKFQMKGTDLLIETYRSFATPPRLYTNITTSRSYTADAEARDTRNN